MDRSSLSWSIDVKMDIMNTALGQLYEKYTNKTTGYPDLFYDSMMMQSREVVILDKHIEFEELCVSVGHSVIAFPN